MRIGERFRYGRQASFPAHQQTTPDGLTNWWWATAPDPGSGDRPVKIDSGIDWIGRVRGSDGERIPAVLLRSSPHKIGSATTPWQDVIRSDDGYVRYFGDNRIEKRVAAHQTDGNALMLEALPAHQSIDRQAREVAPPILVFEAFQHQGREKGQVIFQGLAVLERAELIVQQDPRGRGSFTNYRYSLVVLDLVKDDDQIDWRWINARRDPSRASSDANKLAPAAWREWTRLGAPALERLQRRVLRRAIVPEGVQRPAAGTEEAKILQGILGYYPSPRKHRFEVLADFVVSQILQSQGLAYSPGWVTRGTGDAGVDFVGRVDLDRDGAFLSSRIVLLGQAKCEAKPQGTSGRDVARLAARLRRGWIGAYVTTSYFTYKVQEEILIDRFPVILVDGARLAAVVRQHLLATAKDLKDFLDELDATYDDRLGRGDPEQVLL